MFLVRSDITFLRRKKIKHIQTGGKRLLEARRGDAKASGLCTYLYCYVTNLIEELLVIGALPQGQDVYFVDLHIPPTWLPPSSCDPLLSLTVSTHNTLN